MSDPARPGRNPPLGVDDLYQLVTEGARHILGPGPGPGPGPEGAPGVVARLRIDRAAGEMTLDFTPGKVDGLILDVDGARSLVRALLRAVATLEGREPGHDRPRLRQGYGRDLAGELGREKGGHHPPIRRPPRGRNGP